MELQGTRGETDSGNPSAATAVPRNGAGIEIRSQVPSIPPAPFFPAFHGMGGQIPFMFPPPYMTPAARPAFASSGHEARTSPVDLTAASQKRPSEECVTEQTKPTKKRRAPRKKPEIVHLDDSKDDVDLQKNVGHWKDHWVIQLISIRGEMHSTFSAPPKQGDVLNVCIFLSFFLFFGRE